MAEGGVQRRLAVIVIADVVGYSHHMERDAVGTRERFHAIQNDLVEPILVDHQGRVVNTMGDAFLIEFNSVVGAVEAAVQFQRRMAETEADKQSDEQIQFRIGVNLGEIIVEGDDIHGEGVNVAARLEALADPGGIVISGRVHEQLHDDVDVGYEFMGEQQVKNVERLVRTYKVLLDPADAGKAPMPPASKQITPRAYKSIAAALVLLIMLTGGGAWWWSQQPDFEPADPKKFAYKLPDKPSIAVLPFNNLTGDKNQEYLADGLTENIIAVLSKSPDLFIIARNSSFTYKGKATKVQKIAEELGVRYILEGSVQKSGDTIRVTAQLIDAIDGKHLWADQYDKNLKDVFSVWDEITQNILVAMHLKLTRGGDAVSDWEMHKRDREAYRLNIEGTVHFQTFSPTGHRIAERMFSELLERQPDNPAALTKMGYLHWQKVVLGLSKNPATDKKKARDFATKALAITDNFDQVYLLLATLDNLDGSITAAYKNAKRGLELAPASGSSIALAGWIYSTAGHAEEGVRLLKLAMRTEPDYPQWIPGILSLALMKIGRNDEAMEVNDSILASRLEDVRAHGWALMRRAVFEVFSGDEAAARMTVQKLLAIQPTSNNAELVRFTQNDYYKEFFDRFHDALRKAGFPEHAPGKGPKAKPTKPSIAVLPFVNLSDDKDQEYFADGMTDDLITDLSKISGLFVIARNSSFQFKGKSIDVKAVGHELGVRYLLEGSVRRVGDRVRINAQLVDTTSGGHLWAERYEGAIADIFSLQDSVIAKIVSALAVELTDSDQKTLAERHQNVNLEAYDYVLRGRQLLSRIEGQETEKARAMFKKAIAVDPNYARAHLNLGLLHLYEWSIWGLEKERNLAQALAFGQKAAELDPVAPGAHALIASVYQYLGEHDKAEVEGAKALALDPTHAETLALLGAYLARAGPVGEAIKVLKKAIRLDPYLPPRYVFHLGWSYFGAEMYEEAVRVLRRGATREPNYIAFHLWLAASYAMLDRMAEAKAEVAEVLRLNPDFTMTAFSAWATTYTSRKFQANLERRLGALRKAGIPD